jgi:hypothetical protein
MSPDWHQRDAAILAIGAVMEGPEDDCMKPFVRVVRSAATDTAAAATATATAATAAACCCLLLLLAAACCCLLLLAAAAARAVVVFVMAVRTLVAPANAADAADAAARLVRHRNRCCWKASVG